MARYSTTRQKVCVHCASAKTKCDRKEGSCGRCAMRGLDCAYPEPLQAASNTTGDAVQETAVQKSASPSSTEDNGQAMVGGVVTTIGPPMRTQYPHRNALRNTSQYFTKHPPVTTHFECTINVEHIRNRWLNAFIPDPAQPEKKILPSTFAIVTRVLRANMNMALRGDHFPPFIHPSMLTHPATGSLDPDHHVLRCCTKLRSLDEPPPILGSTAAVVELVRKDMDDLLEGRDSFDHAASLAAFQAYLLCCITLYFKLGRDSALFNFRQAVVDLEEIASSCCRRGVVVRTSVATATTTTTAVSEPQVSDNVVPDFDAWILAESKRRTLLAMYVFDNYLTVQDGMPTFLGTELAGLPAPASKSTWQTYCTPGSTHHDWRTTYEKHLQRWPDGGLTVDELWPTPADMPAHAVAARRARVDRWLEEVDEFGMAMFCITSGAHGG